MERIAFIIRALPGSRDAVDAALRGAAEALRAQASERRIENFSMWGVEDMFYGYGECQGDPDAMAAIWGRLGEMLKGHAEMLCAPGTLRLMYHDIGVVRADKNLIRHRVFATKLKPGCAEEYKRRHDGLIAARGDAVSEGPDSNFTIWYGEGYIFGYCEKVRSFDRPMTDAEKRDTIAWETRQLEIMDWLTDDVDWISGEKHEHVRRLV